MTKAISFPSFVCCAEKKDFQKQRFTHTHVRLMNENVSITIFTWTMFLLQILGLGDGWNFMHLVFDLWRIDGFLGLLLLSQAEYLSVFVYCEMSNGPSIPFFFWDLHENLFFEIFFCDKIPLALAIITNARCRQLINPPKSDLHLVSKISLSIINYNVSKCDLSSAKKKKESKTSRRPKIIFYHRNRWRRKKNRLKIDVRDWKLVEG